MDYQTFLRRKAKALAPSGLDVLPDLPSSLFEFQRRAVSLALRRGRCAWFLDTGLGKGFVQLSTLDVLTREKPGLLLAPLGVAHQFAREAEKLGVDARVITQDSDVLGRGIHVCNYEKLHRLDPGRFHAVSLDEASILKSHDGKTRTAIIESFAATPYRFAATATPSPNDHVELANYVEFLGVCSRSEYLATWYTHDGETTQEWRLKRHAVDAHWRFLASLAIAARKPSDLGVPESEDATFQLPPLTTETHVVAMDQRQAWASGVLFATEAATLLDQRAARRSSLSERVRLSVELAATASGQVIVWCDLNDEGNELERAIPDCVQLSGADKDDVKEAKIRAFLAGEARVIVSKPSILGFGLNLQCAATQVFCGVTHSWEAYYQSIRRSYRFGQTRPVTIHVVASEAEAAVLRSLARKQAQADEQAAKMVHAMRDTVLADIAQATARVTDVYEPTKRMEIPSWLRSEA